MTTNRHLALMALMSELEGPTNSYRHAVNQAARQITDSPDFNATVARGNRALDDIEQAVRLWVAKHPEQPDAETPLPDGFERQSCITVKCTACGRVYDESEYLHHFPTLGDALDGPVGAGWDELKDGRVLCETQDEKHEELRRTVGVADHDADLPA